MTTRYFDPRPQVCDANGNPIPGAKLYTYEAGTSTPLATYSDSALTVSNTNPIIMGADGRPQVDIFYGAFNYRLILTDANDVTIWTADPVDGATTDLTSTLLTVSGTADAIILTSPFVASTYQAGQVLRFIASGANTVTGPTINWNGLGTRNVVRSDGTAPPVGAWRASDVLEVIYDGSAFRLLSPFVGAFRLLARQTASAVSAVTFTWPTTTRFVRVRLGPVSVTNSGAALSLRCLTAGVADAGASDYSAVLLTNTTAAATPSGGLGNAIGIADSLNNLTFDSALSFSLEINTGTSSARFSAMARALYVNTTPAIVQRFAGGLRDAPGFKNGITIFPSAGTMSGEFLVEVAD